MPFPTDTYLKVIKCLNLTIDDEIVVKAALAIAEATPEVETEVTNILDQIAVLEGSILAELSSPNSAMIRADVVEWEGGGARAKGMKQALGTLKQQLANLLGLEYNLAPGYGCGTFSLPTRTIL